MRWASVCVWAVAGCADDFAGGASASLGETSSTTAGGIITPTTGAPQLDLGAPDCGLGNGDLGLSFIWIANSTQGTISKIDTLHAANCGVFGRIQAVG